MRRAKAAAALACGSVLFAPALSWAQAIRFDIPAQPLADGVMAVGRQAGVSVGVRDTAGCARLGRAARGVLTVDQALARVLAGSGCSYRRVDARTFVVAAAPSGRAEPPPAAPAAPDRPDLLGSVVVSTARRDVLVGRTPYAISALSAAELSAAGVVGSQGLAQQLAGLTETNLGAGRDKLMIRGVSDGAFTGRTQSTVGIYLDDVPIVYSAPNPDLLLTDVERVEVLRGPQGSLYGVGSVGGLVRIVTRRPDAGGFHAAASVGLASVAHGGTGTTLTGMANLPLLRDRVALRAVAYSETSAGYLDNAALGLSDVNRATRRGVRLSGAARLGPDWRLFAGFTQQFLDADDGQSALAARRLERGRAMLEPHDNDFRQASLTLERKGGWGGLKASFGYVRHAYDTRYDATPAAAQFGLPPGPAVYDEDNQVEFTVAEAVVTTAETGRLQGLIGAFAANAELETRYAVGQGAPAYLERRTDTVREAALFGEAVYAVTDRLKLTVGARAFAAAIRTASTNRPFGATPGGRLDKADLVPKLVLAFQARPDLLVYAQAAEGYRQGGFNTSGLAGPGLAGLTFRGDELWSYEAGVKAALLDGRLQVEAAAFATSWRDVQSDQFLAAGLPYTANVGDARNHGLELEARVRASSRLSLRGNLLLNGPELSRPAPAFVGREDGGLPVVAKTSLVGAADYQRPLAGGLTLSLHGQLEYVGRSRLSFGAPAAPSMGGYVTNRLSLQIASARWRAQAYVENIADARADTFTFGNPFSAGQAYVTPMRPRAVGLTLGAAF